MKASPMMMWPVASTDMGVSAAIGCQCLRRYAKLWLTDACDVESRASTDPRAPKPEAPKPQPLYWALEYHT